jgi:hypothetical protein
MELFLFYLPNMIHFFRNPRKKTKGFLFETILLGWSAVFFLGLVA